MHTKIVTFGIEIVLKLLTTPQQQIQLIDYKIQLCLFDTSRQTPVMCSLLFFTFLSFVCTHEHLF